MAALTVCLTFDVDGMSAWIGSVKSNNPSVLSRGEFTVVGTPRILNLLAKKHIQATFFIPGHTAYAFPDLVKQIRDAGHEIGHHGWCTKTRRILILLESGGSWSRVSQRWKG